MKNEPILLKHLSNLTAHQVFDQMPKSLISSEIKLLDESTKKIEVLPKEELLV